MCDITSVAVAGIIVAAGAGTRMGAALPKALMPVAGRPLLAWSLDVFASTPAIDDVVVVGPPDALAEIAAVAAGRARVVAGGATRAHSVANGLAALATVATHVLVHDAARPLVTGRLLDLLIERLATVDAVIAAGPVADTLKRVDGSGAIAGTVDRADLWGAQTPQAFSVAALRAAYAALGEAIATATDCAAVMEAAGQAVHVLEWGEPNPKVTRPGDVALIESLLAARGR